MLDDRYYQVKQSFYEGVTTMKHFISQKKHIVITILLAITVAVIIFFIIKAAAQCAPDDLNCLSMP